MSRFSIGYALAPKKQQSFVQDSLLNLAQKKGLDFIKIDIDKPISDQGPFNCILHKLPTNNDWRKQLEKYSIQNPNVLIIDQPDAIDRLHNRISMLQVVSELNVDQENETFGIPKQIVVHELLDPALVMQELVFPVIAKPLVADGSAKSHKMSLVFNRDGFNKLKPPIVLQEFVNHGGVIFKVYVVGDYVKCVKRKSLPDVSEEKLGSLEGSLSFSQISNLTSQERIEDYEARNVDEAEMPPLSFINGIARELRRAMRLNLFNFDVIRDVRVGNHYLVIDINYFPGYAKMPSYETVLTDFFCELFQKQKEEEQMTVGAGGGGSKLLVDCDKDEKKLEVVPPVSRDEKEITVQLVS